LASATASFGEEILCRLFLLSALLRILPASSSGTLIAVSVSSLLFAVLHAPAAVFLFGGFDKVPLLTWVWMASLNAFVGIACAMWYLRIGIGGAILAHFATDLVWHMLPQGSRKLANCWLRSPSGSRKGSRHQTCEKPASCSVARGAAPRCKPQG